MEDASGPPLLDRLSRGSEWWFTPRWRALVTWVILAALSNAAWAGAVGSFVGKIEMSLYDNFLKLYPYVFYRLFQISTAYPLFVWYQPLVLRLGRVRWVIWIVASTVSAAIFVHWDQWSSPWLEPLSYWAWPMLAGLLMIGHRTRPWMSMPAGALSLFVAYWLYHGGGLRFFRIPGYYWWRDAAAAIPFGVVMLYGTRLLTPEERSGEMVRATSRA